jgi:hypothetical protein
MTDNGWGGKREGAGSGGKREGAGRPRTRWNSGGKGQVWIVEISKPGGFSGKPQQWRVLNIDEDGTIEFQNVETEEIISLTHPDEYL